MVMLYLPKNSKVNSQWMPAQDPTMKEHAGSNPPLELRAQASLWTVGMEKLLSDLMLMDSMVGAYLTEVG